MKSLALPILIIASMLGCKSIKPYAAQNAGEATGRIQGKTSALLANFDVMKTEVTPAGKYVLEASRNIVVSIEPDITDIRTNTRQLQSNYEISEARYAKLEGKWYVWAGRKIQWIVGIGLFGWLALGIAGIFLPVGGLGSAILRVLPLANVFAWIRELIYPGHILKTPRAAG